MNITMDLSPDNTTKHFHFKEREAECAVCANMTDPFKRCALCTGVANVNSKITVEDGVTRIDILTLLAVVLTVGGLIFGAVK